MNITKNFEFIMQISVLLLVIFNSVAYHPSVGDCGGSNSHYTINLEALEIVRNDRNKYMFQDLMNNQFSRVM